MRLFSYHHDFYNPGINTQSPQIMQPRQSLQQNVQPITTPKPVPQPITRNHSLITPSPLTPQLSSPSSDPYPDSPNSISKPLPSTKLNPVSSTPRINLLPNNPSQASLREESMNLMRNLGPALFREFGPPIARRIGPPIARRLGPPLVEKVGLPLAKKVGIPLAKRVCLPLVKKLGGFVLTRIGF